MSNKFETGKYLVFIYDPYGTKQATVKADSFIDAVRKGTDMTLNPPLASYVILRVLANSLDNANPWGSK